MGLESEKAIGGYQGLELPFFNENLARATIKTNSARSALKVILNAVGAQKIRLPAYTCDAVIDAIKALEIAFEFYRITPTFDVEDGVHLDKGEYILVVDYFGVSANSVKRSLQRFGTDNTIVDCSQAFFSPLTDALGTVWSPRKFFGLPDGGLAYSVDSRITDPERRDNTSESRMAHLISRLTNSPEEAYQKYLEAEQAIAASPVLGMSRLTERLLCSVDYDGAKHARIRNTRCLHDLLGKYNQLNVDLDNGTAPLCYPFLPKVKTASKSELIENRAFVPSYWPEVQTRVETGSFEWDLVMKCLFLPCDQRYTEHDMNRLVSLLAIK